MNFDIENEEEQLATDLALNDYTLLMDLIRLRRSLGLKQVHVAERMGVSQPTIAKFESMDTDPKLSTVRRYALALGALVEHKISHTQRSFRDGEWVVISNTTTEEFRDIRVEAKLWRSVVSDAAIFSNVCVLDYSPIEVDYDWFTIGTATPSQPAARARVHA